MQAAFSQSPFHPIQSSHAAFTRKLIDDLREPGSDPVLSPTRYLSLVKIDIGEFARNAGVHRNTVSRAPNSASVQDFLRKNVRVISAAFDASGNDMAKALLWFRNEPLAPFAYKTAEQLVAEGRVDDVIRLIESYEAGAAG
jgi:hypothetical protein